ncbi:MAG: glycosyl transferase family 36, partial [Lentisphaerota bacterium]
MTKLFENKYGYFDGEKGEYVIKRPDTPRPWVNIIANPNFGLTLSQAGSGYSWRDHAQFNRLTRWDQDLTRDNWGKYVFIRDEKTGEFWSPTPKPAGSGLKDYECRHGMGYSIIKGRQSGIASRMTFFADHKDPVEVWILELSNESSRVRNLSTFTYLEWCLGVAPDSHREFDKLFIETKFEPASGAILARKTRWGLPDPSGRPWSRPYTFYGFHATSPKAVSFDSDQSKFLGQLGDLSAP